MDTSSDSSLFAFNNTALQQRKDLQEQATQLPSEIYSERLLLLDMVERLQIRVQEAEKQIAELSSRRTLLIHDSDVSHFDIFTCSYPRPNEWISEVRQFVSSHFIAECDRVNFILSHLDRDVKNELRVYLNLSQTSSTDIFQILLSSYGDDRFVEQVRFEFSTRVQRPGETIQQYSAALIDLMVNLSIRMPMEHQTMQDMLMEHFVTGILDAQLQNYLRYWIFMQPKLSFREIRKMAVRNSDEASTQGFTTAVGTQTDTSSIAEVKQLDLEKSIQIHLRDVDTLTKELFPSQKSSSSEELKNCLFCGKGGHKANFCYRRQRYMTRLRKQVKGSGSSHSIATLSARETPDRVPVVSPSTKASFSTGVSSVSQPVAKNSFSAGGSRVAEASSSSHIPVFSHSLSVNASHVPAVHQLNSFDTRIQLAQQKDLDIVWFLQFHASGMRPVYDQYQGDSANVKHYVKNWHKFNVVDGVLYRVFDDTGKRIKQLVVPSSFQQAVIQLAHGTNHLQTESNIQAVQDKGYYWPFIRRSIVSFCQQCTICQRSTKLRS